MEGANQVAGRRGLNLPGRVRSRLRQVGVFARPEVSLEHQHLAHRYVLRGVESGGAIQEIGHYVSFANDDGEPLAYLHPIDAIGVNGVHAVVVAPAWSESKCCELAGRTSCSSHAIRSARLRMAVARHSRVRWCSRECMATWTSSCGGRTKTTPGW